ncbi:MAG: hypothetical protein HY986_13330 [Candidatus Melainabacteria bacterium]|nr:hypothetical protein [Candidatus Melainabacteria bacterium]
MTTRRKKKKRKDRDRLKVGTITREQILKMDRRARREIAIENGSYTNAGAGSGAHGGDKKAQSKRKRRANKQAAKTALTQD